MFDVYRAWIQEWYLDEIQASLGGGGDHTPGALARPLSSPDKGVGPEDRTAVP